MNDTKKCILDYITCECEFCTHGRKMARWMAENYNNGATLTEIGKKLNCSRKIISNRLKLHGYVKEKRKYVQAEKRGIEG